MLALLGAMEEEITKLQRHMVLQEAFTRLDCHMYRGKYRDKTVLLGQTGLGKERAEAATRFVLEHYPVTAVISFGFAGGLTEESKIGDVIICSTLYAANEQIHKEPQPENPCYSDDSLVSPVLQAMESTRTRFRQGSSVTVVRPALSPEAKLVLGQTFHADVVDMESYWVARVASDRHIPFLAIRAISDTIWDNLPPCDQILDAGGSWQLKKALVYLVTHPQHLIKLFALSKKMRQARKNLTEVIERLVVNL